MSNLCVYWTCPSSTSPSRTIQRDLHASYADVQWALAGYTLAYALVLITGGRAGCSSSATWKVSRLP